MDCGCEERRKIMQGVFSGFSDWLKQPFRDDMNVGGWVAFLGLLIAIMAFWGWVLTRLK